MNCNKIAAILLGAVVILSIVLIQTLRHEEAPDFKAKYDSLKVLQDASIKREAEILKQKEALIKKSDSLLNKIEERQPIYITNKQEYEKVKIHIDTLSDTLYEDYLRSRQLPEGYGN